MKLSIEKYEIKDKIVEVWAAARVIVQKYGHTKKFAKHIVALVIKPQRYFMFNLCHHMYLVSKPPGLSPFP